MTINYYPFRSSEDLDRQYQFWNRVTSKLPYAWKATRSPTKYQTLNEFNPKSKAFAFDDENLVGYMSFSGEGEFVSPGYPWHLEEYSYIKDELWDKVFGYASNEHGGKQFLQRFRGLWTDQINYFLSKGFEIQSSFPMIIYELENQLLENVNHNYKIIRSQFDQNIYFELLKKNSEVNDNQIAGMKEYYSVVEFDTTIQIHTNNGPIGMIASSNRKDNGFCDILALTYPSDNTEILRILVVELSAILSNYSHLNLTTNEEDISFGILKDMGFKQLTNEVYVYLEL